MSISPQEKYLSASASRNLRMKADTQTDADKLLAAAYAASGDPKRGLALRLYRVKATGATTGFWDMAHSLAVQVRSRRAPGARSGSYLRGNGHHSISQKHAMNLAIRVLEWWRSSTCPKCEGRGHPTYLNSPVLDLSRDCPECKGTGVRPLERNIRSEHIEHARWLVNEMEALSSIVFNDMARLLANRIGIGQK